MIQEIIVLKIKKNRIEDFRKIRSKLHAKVSTAEGFIESGFEKSIEDDSIFLDKTVWANNELKEKFNEKFRKQNYGVELIECFDGAPVYMGCFEMGSNIK